MDTIHLLKVSPETRKTIKEQAIRLHNKGKKEAEIADALNISYQAVSRIIRAYKKEGIHSVRRRRGAESTARNGYSLRSRRRKSSGPSSTNVPIR